jgi:uncharacterized protein (TIGR00369 family)
MVFKVTAKQNNSKMCFVCGLKNPNGLGASFFELDNGELLAVFEPRDVFQGYPGRLHGGIAATILDETIGRAVLIEQQEVWGVTVEFQIRYHQPVPLGQPVHVIGRVDRDRSRLFEGSGEILLPNGEVAVEGHGKYLKLPLDQIADFDHEQQEWKVVPDPDDPQEFSY